MRWICPDYKIIYAAIEHPENLKRKTDLDIHRPNVFLFSCHRLVHTLINSFDKWWITSFFSVARFFPATCFINRLRNEVRSCWAVTKSSTLKCKGVQGCCVWSRVRILTLRPPVPSPSRRQPTGSRWRTWPRKSWTTCWRSPRSGTARTRTASPSPPCLLLGRPRTSRAPRWAPLPQERCPHTSVAGGSDSREH